MVTRRRHTLRHPFRGDRRYARPAGGSRRARPSRTRSGLRLTRRNGPRMRPRRKVHVASIVTTPPEEVPSRPGVRLYVIGVVVLVLFAVMVLRLWTLQVINHKSYAAAVTSNEVRLVTVPAPRGPIVDRQGTPLVENRYQFEVLLSRVQASLHPEIIARLAALIGKPAKTIRLALTTPQYSPYQPVPVLDPATTTIVQYLEAHKSEYPGVTVTQVAQRSYPQGGTTAAQVLGYVAPITAAELKAHPGYSQSSQFGQTGIEAEYQKYLHGAHGREELEVNATGTVVGTLTQTQPSPGDTVQLNVTLGLQKAVQQALAQVIAADRSNLGSPATNGAAMVLNAQTGAVLAMASYPDYSLTTWVGGISTARYRALTAGCTSAVTASCPTDNYAIQGLYTPGSTFKVATATVALHDGLITPYSTVDDTGVFSMRAHTYPTCKGQCTFKDATAFDAGVVTVSAAITRSDDFFFYTLGVRFYHTSVTVPKYNVNAIQDTANSLGLGELTGIDLPGEVQGRVDGKTERLKLHQQTPTGFPNTFWYPATSLEVAFGQGGTVLTPIEMAQAYATFADHGVKHQPEVAADIVSPSGKVVQKIAPKVTGHVTYNAADWTAMLRGFVGVTHTATGTAYGIFQKYSHVPATYTIAGKTGTATVSPTTKVHPPNAWFVGFGPVNHAPNQPEYVVVTTVNEAGYGDAAAAPAVATIFNYLYAHPVTGTPTLPAPTPSATKSGTSPSTAPGATGATGAKASSTTPSTTTTTTRTTTAPGTRATPTTTTPKKTTHHSTTTTGANGRTTSVVDPATGGRSPPARLSAARSPP